MISDGEKFGPFEPFASSKVRISQGGFLGFSVYFFIYKIAEFTQIEFIEKTINKAALVGPIA